jgi:Secretion system C-terminal sorting domain
MKTELSLITFLLGVSSFAQIAFSSFEEPLLHNGSYFDQGDASVAHNLMNNENEPLVNWQSTGNELGFSARYVPYNNPDVGLTDGDTVGVTDRTSVVSAFPDGLKGYEMSDCDGNFILEFDSVNLNGVSNPTVSIDFFIAETGYEGDGTENEASSDRLRIYIKDIDQGIETDLLNTTGSDINDLAIEGVWITATANLDSDTEVQLVIEARTNAGVEAFFFDNIMFNGDLGVSEAHVFDFEIFPNPASDHIHITSPYKGSKHIRVFDILGKEVFETWLKKDTLTINSLNSGVYFLQMTQGAFTTTKKFVVR